MNAYLLPGVLGLVAGLLLHWAGFANSEGLHQALGCRRSIPLRSGLSAIGYGIALTALLMWLAVIDVDTVMVLPLTPGTVLGGALLGVCAGLCGFTPTTAFAGLGSGVALEAFCVLLGCGGMTWLLPALSGVLSPLHTLWVDATIFRVTLDEPALTQQGFLAQGCAGLLLVAIAICIPSPRAAVDIPPLDIPDTPPLPEDAPEETFIALLEGEEPLVVDTSLDAPPAAPEDAPESEASPLAAAESPEE